MFTLFGKIWLLYLMQVPVDVIQMSYFELWFTLT